MAAPHHPDPAQFALHFAVGCAKIMEPLLGWMERAAATGNHVAAAAASMLTIFTVAGYFVVVSRAFAVCMRRRR